MKWIIVATLVVFLNWTSADEDIDSRLIAAMKDRNEEEAENLLKNGANPNVRDSENGFTPLHYAIMNEWGGVEDLLYDHGADVNAKDNMGRTPLFYAHLYDLSISVRELYVHMADGDVKDKDGNTAEMFAAQNAYRFEVPHDAVFVGSDINGDKIYAGLVYHANHWIPAKVIPAQKSAYIPFEGREIKSHEYQLITGSGFHWVHASYGQIPQDAVIGGTQPNGERVYVGRANIQGSLITGKVVRLAGRISVPFAGSEHNLPEYEVLVQTTTDASIQANTNEDKSKIDATNDDNDSANQSSSGLKCKICHKDSLEPMALPCDHVFCKNCIKQMSSCPTCRSKFNYAECRKIYI